MTESYRGMTVSRRSGPNHRQAILRQIGHHLSKGRDAGTICTMLGIPLSKVKKLIAAYRKEQSE